MSEICSDLQLYPRIPDKKTIHDPRYNPDTYISIQTHVDVYVEVVYLVVRVVVVVSGSE